ncbi:energy-coupling factor transporter ATP-binding protein EcfA2 [Novosphingobium sp. SG751A]|uniref:AAA family ATPase n=1 Tax=Novosphingobium sp. SG751A TaxID=2587000 RepID=UPI001553DDCA|nr:AAA family ATPase [Novosphingobium sp. SG751A]NOW45703.1 energy-coupling factor transporter ATP-binding protein EcfA2 [Novosphingobium sp. SG751A]
MRISFENFGKAGRGDIHINDLTIICGPNGSGKTYASYAVYGCIKGLSEILDFDIDEDKFKDLLSGKSIEINLEDILKDISSVIQKAGFSFAKNLDAFFNAPEGFFENSKFSFTIDEHEVSIPRSFSAEAAINKAVRLDFELAEGGHNLQIICTGQVDTRFPRQVLRRLLCQVIADCLLGEKIPTPFVVTSERTGVALFYKELDINRNAIFSHISSSDKIDPLKILQAMGSRYARPIQDNIDIIRDYGQVSKRKSFLKGDKNKFSSVFSALSDLVGGSYRGNDDQLSFIPKKDKNRPKLSVPLYISSSSVKSLFLIDIYINHLAQKGGMLIIDEPELNLHPDNQVKIARLVARLVNSGVKVLVTTHSDYFIREVNNLISLGSVSTDRREFIMKEYGYVSEDVLKSESVSAYCSVPGRGIVEMDKMASGIDTKIFDDIISTENFKSQDIYSIVNA